MSVAVIERLFAFFDNVWSFIWTLVRSLLALFSFRRRSSDPFSLPSVNRIPRDTLARTHARLRPILLTPRSIAFSAAQRAQSTRSRSATSTLFPGHDEHPSASGSAPPPSGPDRTSPKLDPHDPELGLSAPAAPTCDHALGHPGTTTTSSSEGTGTPDTSLPTTHTASLSVVPLTPPDRCYLVPIPSATDCPYAESWPTNLPLDRSKSRLPGSPLKASINHNTDPVLMVGPIGSPPPGRWSPVQIWTSTPCKSDNHVVPDPAVSPFNHHSKSTMDPLAHISNALISRSRSSIQPYDDVSNSSSSDASLSVDDTNGRPIRETCVRVPRSQNQLYPQFHHPDAYAFAWRRHPARLPGKPGRTSHTHAYPRSHSHADLLTTTTTEWYDADAYAPSPISALSPPRCDSGTDESIDEELMPLGRLRERIARRRGANVGLGAGTRPLKTAVAVGMSPRTRRMSEGCLLALSESTPTRVGVGARSRNVISLALDGDGDGAKDWLEALSLRFSTEQRDALAPVPVAG